MKNKRKDIYQKHIGINAEHQYTPTPREWVFDAMEEYAGERSRKLIEAINKRNELIYAMMRNSFNYQIFMVNKTIDINSLYKSYKVSKMTEGKIAKDRIELLNKDWK